MTADAPGEEPPASEAEAPSWLRRLAEFETGRRFPERPPGAERGAAGDSVAAPSDGDRSGQEAADGDSRRDGTPDGCRPRDPRARRPSSHFPPGVGPADVTAGPRDSDSGAPSRGAGAAADQADAPSSDSPLLRAVRREADFSRIRLSGAPADHAYGRTVRATVADGTDRGAVSLRLFRRPDADQDGLAAALATQLDRWAAASDVDGLLPLIESAAAPRPWACTAPLGPTLVAFERRSLVRALRDARDLAATLRSLHDRGVIHAGLEPETVVYPRRVRGRTTPMLDAPGLLDVYRRYVDPATILDPRYAAPEYYETDRGLVDRATDVYGLGAVLFTLFTGRPPYDGDPEAVREAVLAEAVPLPSTVDPRVPAGIDEVVETAMAPDKFDRFETAGALADAIDAVCRDVLAADGDGSE